jgi:hypothetical protein
MQRFSDYIKEGVKSPERGIGTKAQDWLRMATKHMAKLSSQPVLWRGFHYQKGGYVKVPGVNMVALVTNKKQRTFRGSSHGFEKHEAVEAVISGICDNAPVFCSNNYDKAKFFGSPYLVLPIPQFKVAHSQEIHDIGTITSKRTPTGGGGNTVTKAEYTEDQVQQMIDSYTISTNKVTSISGYSEVILDCKKYGLIDINSLIRMNRSKFLKIKRAEDVHTYADALHVINNTLSYLDWVAKR